jgi:hypothetical protein
MNEIKVNSYTGNGAAQTFELGFQPGAVLIFNQTDGTNFSVFFGNMAAASAISVVTTAGPVLDTTNQITLFAGDATRAPGFTVGTDLSVNAKVYGYIAFRAAHPKSQPATAGAQTGASA